VGSIVGAALALFVLAPWMAAVAIADHASGRRHAAAIAVGWVAACVSIWAALTVWRLWGGGPSLAVLLPPAFKRPMEGRFAQRWRERVRSNEQKLDAMPAWVLALIYGLPAVVVFGLYFAAALE
jgi:hypothetical protein